MTFVYTWNAAFEALPANSEYFHLGAGKLRDFKLALRERLSVNHYMSLSGGDNQGEHIQLTLREGSAPTNAASKGFIYSKDMSGVSELFYIDSEGNEVQITNGGIVGQDMPAGTKMLFYQDVAPAGWTLENVDDKMAFITKGSGASGETGGGAHSSGTWTQPNHTHEDHATLYHRHFIMNTHFYDGWSYTSGAGSGYLTVNAASKAGVWGGIGTEFPSNPSFGPPNESDIYSDAATVNTWRPSSFCFVIAAKD